MYEFIKTHKTLNDIVSIMCWTILFVAIRVIIHPMTIGELIESTMDFVKYYR